MQGAILIARRARKGQAPLVPKVDIDSERRDVLEMAKRAPRSGASRSCGPNVASVSVCMYDYYHWLFFWKNCKFGIVVESKV